MWGNGHTKCVKSMCFRARWSRDRGLVPHDRILFLKTKIDTHRTETHSTWKGTNKKEKYEGIFYSPHLLLHCSRLLIKGGEGAVMRRKRASTVTPFAFLPEIPVNINADTVSQKSVP